MVVRACALRSGMVLEHDVRNAHGALLVSAGTAVTARTTERLTELFGPHTTYEVLIPSASDG